MEGEPSTETRLHSVDRNCDRKPNPSAPSILFVQAEPDSELLILVGNPTTSPCSPCWVLTLLYQRSKRALQNVRGQAGNRGVWTCGLRGRPEFESPGRKHPNAVAFLVVIASE